MKWSASSQMFPRETLENIWITARTCHRKFPQSYQNLFEAERLAVLPLLEEPIQSTLHQIIQKKVQPGTKCVYKRCKGVLAENGQCQNNCEQSGQTVIHDIMQCKNCDAYGFPCPTCKTEVFQNQLDNILEDY